MTPRKYSTATAVLAATAVMVLTSCSNINTPTPTNTTSASAQLDQSGGTGDPVRDWRAAIVTAAGGDIRSAMDPDWVRTHPGWFNPDGTLRTRQEVLDYQDKNGLRPYDEEAFDTGIRTMLDQLKAAKYPGIPQ